MGGEEWCHRDPQVSAAPRGKYGFEDEEKLWRERDESANRGDEVELGTANRDDELRESKPAKRVDEMRENRPANRVDEVGKNSLTMLMGRTREQTDVSSGEQGLLVDGRVNEGEKQRAAKARETK